MKPLKWMENGADPTWYPRVLRVLERDFPQVSHDVWSAAIAENADENVAKRKVMAEEPCKPLFGEGEVLPEHDFSPYEFYPGFSSCQRCTALKANPK